MQPPRVIAQFIKRSHAQVLALKATFSFRKSEKLKAESYPSFNKFISVVSRRVLSFMENQLQRMNK